MAYRVEITADTLTELGGKLLALASQFHTTAVDPVMPEVKVAEPAKAKAKGNPKKEVEPEVADAGEPTPSTSETSAPSPDTSKTSEDAPSATPEASASDAPALDFDKDITPIVLRVAAEKGRDKAIEILRAFGAGRASEVREEHWPDLYAAMKEVL